VLVNVWPDPTMTDADIANFRQRRGCTRLVCPSQVVARLSDGSRALSFEPEGPQGVVSSL
jgi:hypothetical protein